jgi:hypothetical protein
MARFPLLFYLFASLTCAFVWSPVSIAASVTASQFSVESTSSPVSAKPSTITRSSSTLLTSSSLSSSRTASSIKPNVTANALNSICLHKSFDSLDDVWKFQKETNASFAVLANCSNACDRAYGSGNADLAGIGVSTRSTLVATQSNHYFRFSHPISSSSPLAPCSDPSFISRPGALSVITTATPHNAR